MTSFFSAPLCPQFSSVAQSCLTFCDPIDCSRPGFPVHHPSPELAQTYVHRVGDAIQLSHPLPSPSPPAFSLSQHLSSLVEGFVIIQTQNIYLKISGKILQGNSQELSGLDILRLEIQFRYKLCYYWQMNEHF